MATLTIQKNLQSVTEQICNAEQLEKVFNNPETYSKICQIREYRKQGEMKKAAGVKNSLEGIIFVADDFAESEKVVKTKVNGEEQEQTIRGKWRLQKEAHLNGLAVLDVDHLKEDPRELAKQWTEERLRELGVVLEFITSSNEGIKFVFIARKEWGNLIQNACELARQLGLKADETSCSMILSACSVTTIPTTMPPLARLTAMVIVKVRARVLRV